MKRIFRILPLLCLAAPIALPAPCAAQIAPIIPRSVRPATKAAVKRYARTDRTMARLIDITNVQGADACVLYGTGVVSGLRKTGDSAKAARQAIVNYLGNMGHNRVIGDVATGGVAMVMITVKVPAFAKRGMKLDATLSVMNDATSLLGGNLELAMVKGFGPRGESLQAEVFGRVHVGGAEYSQDQNRAIRNHPTVGTAIGGCQLKIAPRTFYLNDSGELELRFLKPSIASVLSAVDAINRVVKGDGFFASSVDEYLLRIKFPEEKQSQDSAMRLLNRIYKLPVSTDRRAKVVIDESTGLILAGQGVQISPCAFAVADIQITIVAEEEVSQPLPGINGGTTEKVDRTRIEVRTGPITEKALDHGATVEELIMNLETMGLTVSQLITVFQKLDAGGFLHAELEYR